MNKKNLKEFDSKNLSSKDLGNQLRLVVDELRSMVNWDGFDEKDYLYPLRLSFELSKIALSRYLDIHEDYLYE